MFAWLMTLPMWFQIILTAGIVILLITITILVTKKGINIKLKRGKNEITIGDDGEIIRERPYSPHRNCPHSRDIIIIINEVTKILQEKYLLTYITQVKDQMKYAEQKIDQVKSMYQKFYLNKLDGKGIDNIVESHSFLSYKLALREIKYEFKSIFRDSFRDNHFDEMSEAKFNIFVKDKFEYLHSEFAEMLNGFYHYQKDITKEEIYGYNKELKPKMQEIITEIYQNARVISLDNKVKLMGMDEKLEKVMDNYI